MGCCMSRHIYPAPSSHGDMRSARGRLSSGRSTVMNKTKADIHIPLSEKEVFALTRSWKPIVKNMVDTGINMFLR